VTKTSQDPFHILLEPLGLTCEGRGSAVTLLCCISKKFKGFYALQGGVSEEARSQGQRTRAAVIPRCFSDQHDVPG